MNIGEENGQADQPNKIVALWLKMPVLVRAIVGGMVVFLTLQFGANALMFANLSMTPNIPWSTPLGMLYLWVVFQFFNGRWGSAATAEARRGSLRAPTHSPGMATGRRCDGYGCCLYHFCDVAHVPFN